MLVYAAQLPKVLEEGTGAVGIAEISKIKRKFATLLKNTCKKLKEKSVDPKELHTFLTSYFSPAECIPNSSDLNEVFDVLNLNKLWDYWNYCPLEEIINGFAADDQEIISWVETYKQDLKSYKVTTTLITLCNTSCN